MIKACPLTFACPSPMLLCVFLPWPNRPRRPPAASRGAGAFARSEANMGRRRAAKGPSAPDDELLEAAMAQAQAERDGMEASQAAASSSASARTRANTRQGRSQATHGS